ncbi:MAG: glycosyltransferase [Candidatus Pacebacteria bacterium]|nr:glycosyltransferase [Candidatus Paceibacterota bacterium]
MKKNKVLIVLWRFPYPAIDGTRYKILNNIVAPLAGIYDIEFLIVSIESVTPEQVEYVENNFGKVHLFKRSKINFLLNFFKGFFVGLPMQVTGYYLKGAQKWLNENIQNYDAVYVHEIRTSEYFKNVTNKSKIIFDFNDAISLNYKQNMKFANFPMNIFYYIEGRRVASYEKRVLGMFENYNVVAKYDRDYLLKMLPSGNSNNNLSLSQNFTTIPHGVSVNNDHNQTQNQSVAKNIFFVGSLGYAPNRDAVKCFLKNIWPKIHAILPEVKFFVIGKGYRFGGFDKLHNVYFPGFVPSLVNYINENDCGIMVAPLRFGSGTPSKIIEAMSMGLPVITTPVACQGIDGVINGHDIVLIESEKIDEWVDSIVHLINNIDEQKNIGQNAKNFIIENNEITVVQKQWLDVFSKITKNK